MPNTTVYTNNQYYQDIADAIRLKNGSSKTYTPAQMAGAINALNVSGTLTLRDAIVTPTENEQIVTPGTGYVGLSSVTINPIDPTYIGSSIARRTLNDVTAAGASVIIPVGYYSTELTKTITTANHLNPSVSIDSETGLITASHTQSAGYVNAGTTTATSQLTIQNATTITPNTSAQTAVEAGKYTLGNVTVAAIQTEEKTTTVNGEVTPSSGKYLTKVTVNVPVGSTINNQNKTVTPTTSQQSVTADSGYTGLGTVTVNAIQTETKSITENGTYTPTTGRYFSSVTVNVAGETYTDGDLLAYGLASNSLASSGEVDSMTLKS